MLLTTYPITFTKEEEENLEISISILEDLSYRLLNLNLMKDCPDDIEYVCAPRYGKEFSTVDIDKLINDLAEIRNVCCVKQKKLKRKGK